MKRHTKIYLDFFGYNISSFIPCEVCGERANDIHHIEARGMGGKNDVADVIENIIALCRKHHIELGDKKQFEDELTDIHFEFMRVNGRYE